jgi:hypothetical protein
MAIIEVQGLDFEIKGDAPTAREQLAIETYLQAQKQVDRKTGNPVFDLSKDSFKINPNDVFIADKLESNEETENFLGSPDFKRLVTEVALSIGGTALAAAFPVAGIPLLAARTARYARPLLNVATRTIGSAAGGGLGAGVSQSFDPKEDITREVTRAAAEGALGNVLGEGAAKVLGGVYNKVVGRKIDTLQSSREAGAAVERQTSEIKNLLNKAEKVGKTNLSEDEIARLARYESQYSSNFTKDFEKAMFTPGQITENTAVDLAENIAESAFFGSSAVKGTKSITESVIRSGLDDFVETAKRIGSGPGKEYITGPDMVGELLRNSVTKSNRIFEATARKGYNVLDKEIQKAASPYIKAQEEVISKNALLPIDKQLPIPANPFQINTKPLKELAQKNITQLEKEGGFAEQAIAKYKKVLNLPDVTDFSSLNQTRSIVLSMGRNLSDDAYKATTGAQKTITNEITKLLDNAQIPPDLINFRARLNNFYKNGATEFNKDIATKLLNDQYGREKIYSQIVANKDRGTLVRNYFDFIDNVYGSGTKGKITKLSPQGQFLKDAVRGEFFRDMLESSTKGGSITGPTSPNANAIKTFLENHKTLLDPTRNAGFLTKQQIKTVKDLQNALAFSQETVLKKPSGLGTVFIQLKQAGALTQLGAAGLGITGTIDPVSTGGIILAPWAVAKAFTNPTISKLIINGAKPRDFRTGITGISQLVTKLAEADIIPKDEANAYIDNLKTQGKEFEKNVKEKKPTYSTTDLKPVNTNITSLQAPVQFQQPNLQQSKPTTTIPQVAPKPVAGGITNIPQERIDQYTNLFGRI